MTADKQYTCIFKCKCGQEHRTSWWGYEEPNFSCQAAPPVAEKTELDPHEALMRWADGPFECPTNPEHKLSHRGFHCEECGIFIGAPKTREEILTALITEREMHNAWRKRAEEAEAALAGKTELDQAGRGDEKAQ